MNASVTENRLCRKYAAIYCSNSVDVSVGTSLSLILMLSLPGCILHCDKLCHHVYSEEVTGFEV